jgi:CheY-like chemotaxis protein
MILFIDDEPDLLKDYDKALRTLGFDVRWASDVEDGMKYFLEHKDEIEAVVLDIMMPPPAILGDRVTDFGLRTGERVLARIREESDRVPVMVFTNMSLSRLELPSYKLVDLREKRETPPFALPKLLKKLIEKVESKMEEDNKGKDHRVVFEAPVHAQQLYVGDAGQQIMAGCSRSTKEEALGSFFDELQGLRARQDLSVELDQRIGHAIDELKRLLMSKCPDRTEVAASVGRFAKLAPWARGKLSELATGTVASVLGGAIVEGVKFSLGI